MYVKAFGVQAKSREDLLRERAAYTQKTAPPRIQPQETPRTKPQEAPRIESQEALPPARLSLPLPARFGVEEILLCCMALWVLFADGEKDYVLLAVLALLFFTR